MAGAIYKVGVAKLVPNLRILRRNLDNSRINSKYFLSKYSNSTLKAKISQFEVNNSVLNLKHGLNTNKTNVCRYRSTMPVGTNVLSSRNLSTKPDPEQAEDISESVWQEEVLFTKHVLDTLKPWENKGIFMDMTFGKGGHTIAILESDPHAKVIGIDRDPSVKPKANEIRKKYPGRFCFLNIKFSEAALTLHGLGVRAGDLAGAVLDAGPSREQFEDAGRGFRDTRHHRLDMRMDGPTGEAVPADLLIQNIDDQDLYKVLKYYGGMRNAKKVANALIQARYAMLKVTTPRDLVETVAGVHGLRPSFDGQQGYVHSSAVTAFQALRMVINNEMRELAAGLRNAHTLLMEGAPLAVISHVRMEDALVKDHFRGLNVDTVSMKNGIVQDPFLKEIGSVTAEECLPWTPLTRHVQQMHWQNKLHAHSYWRHAKLRTAKANKEVRYHARGG